MVLSFKAAKVNKLVLLCFDEAMEDDCRCLLLFEGLLEVADDGVESVVTTGADLVSLLAGAGRWLRWRWLSTSGGMSAGVEGFRCIWCSRIDCRDGEAEAEAVVVEVGVCTDCEARAI